MTIERVFSKKNIVIIVFYFAMLLGFRAYLNFTVRNIVEVSICVLSIPFIIIFGYKAVVWCSIVFFSALMHVDNKMLYVSLCFYTITAFACRKYLISLTLLFHANAFVTFVFDQNQPNINVLIYFSVCVIVFLLIFFYPKLKGKKLNLTDDEKIIVEELLKGKQLKEIDGFSKNTKTEKLKAACQRNNLMNKDELIFLYKYSDNWE